MTTGQKWLIGGGAAVVLTVLGFIFLPKAFAKGKGGDALPPDIIPNPNPGGGAGGNPVDAIIPPPATTPPQYGGGTSWPLKRGSRGQAVASLQKTLSGGGYGRHLKNSNVPLPTSDGVFGQQTEKALKTLFNTTSVSEAMFKRIFLGTERIVAGAGAGAGAGGIS